MILTEIVYRFCSYVVSAAVTTRRMMRASISILGTAILFLITINYNVCSLRAVCVCVTRTPLTDTFI